MKCPQPLIYWFVFLNTNVSLFLMSFFKSVWSHMHTAIYTWNAVLCGFCWIIISFLFGLLSSTFEIFFISIITVRVLSMLVLIAAIFCLISTLRLAFSSCYFCYLVFFSIENTIPFSLISFWGVILDLVVKLSGSLWSYFLFYFVNHL